MLASSSSSLRGSQAKNKQSGMAALELIPLLVIFMLFVGYTYGFFGAIHTGIISSIAARNYAFETFRHRPNLKYFRGNKGSANVGEYLEARYTKFGVRFHNNVASTDRSLFVPVTRNISFVENKNKIVNNSTAAEEYHNSEIMSAIQAGKRYNQAEGSNPLWIRIQYGICINSECGAN